MKKYGIMAFCLMLIVFLSGCNYPNVPEETTTVETADKEHLNKETSTERLGSNMQNEATTDLEFATELDTRSFSIWEKGGWESFINKVEGSSISVNSTEATKKRILSHKMEIEGCSTIDLAYHEFDNSDWDFDVTWLQEKTGEKIRTNFFYIDEGVDVDMVTYRRTLYDEDNDVYVDYHAQRGSYLCLINGKMFIRISISYSCENFDDILKQLLGYAMDIKDIANPGETQ